MRGVDWKRVGNAGFFAGFNLRNRLLNSGGEKSSPREAPKRKISWRVGWFCTMVHKPSHGGGGG